MGNLNSWGFLVPVLIFTHAHLCPDPLSMHRDEFWLHIGLQGLHSKYHFFIILGSFKYSVSWNYIRKFRGWEFLVVSFCLIFLAYYISKCFIAFSDTWLRYDILRLDKAVYKYMSTTYSWKSFVVICLSQCWDMPVFFSQIRIFLQFFNFLIEYVLL